MNTEEEFQAALDVNPSDWQTRLAFANWLDERGDPRATGYRALAVQRRYPLQSEHSATKEAAWWWHCPKSHNLLTRLFSFLRKLPKDTHTEDFHNYLPPDWFALLPVDEGNQQFWPVHTERGGVKSRRECENAAALAFARLPAERQAELLATLPEGAVRRAGTFEVHSPALVQAGLP